MSSHIDNDKRYLEKILSMQIGYVLAAFQLYIILRRVFFYGALKRGQHD